MAVSRDLPALQGPQGNRLTFGRLTCEGGQRELSVEGSAVISYSFIYRFIY